VGGRLGEPVDQPAHGYLLHPGSNQGNSVTNKKEPVVPGMQGSKDQPHAGELRRIIIP